MALTTRVLVVDDSPIVRRMVTKVIDADADFEVVGTAGDGAEAVKQVIRRRPHVVVLDLVMPGIDGLEAMIRLRADHRDVKIIVFSNLDIEKSEKLVGLLSSESIDIVMKPTGVDSPEKAMDLIRQNLLPLLPRPAETSQRVASRHRRGPTIRAVCFAASTGGPKALEQVFAQLPKLPVPVFIVQHIPADFSRRLAARLNEISPATVVEAGDREQISPGMVYLAPGAVHMEVGRRGVTSVVLLNDGPPVNSCRPSADLLFASAVEVYGDGVLGVVLTGIGEDGLAGCRALAARGATILAQDEASSTVWGMPGAVVQAGLADEVLSLDNVAERIDRLVLTRSRAVT